MVFLKCRTPSCHAPLAVTNISFGEFDLFSNENYYFCRKIKQVEEQKSKYISNIEIKGLWGRYDVNWKLNSDVNILVGENGTGKSTILKLVYTYLKWSSTLLNRFMFEAETKQGLILRKSNSLKIQFNDKDSIETIYNPETGFNKILKSSLFYLNISLITTFDSISEISELDKKFSTELNTELDFYLQKEIVNFISYQLDLSKKIINKKQDVDIVFAKRKYFIQIVNHLFSKTGKILDENENGITFLLGDKQIKTYELSSGEKQLLLILLTVLNQDEKPSILLMDEPEISLHLRWQYELIEILRTLNPNCQLIIATHSPSIFNHGWRDKVFWIEDIVKEKEAVHE